MFSARDAHILTCPFADATHNYGILALFYVETKLSEDRLIDSASERFTVIAIRIELNYELRYVTIEVRFQMHNLPMNYTQLYVVNVESYSLYL